MHDDIRPSYRKGSDSSKQDDIEELDNIESLDEDDTLPNPAAEAASSEEEVDEKELEDEFGPPPLEEKGDEETPSDQTEKRRRFSWPPSKRQLVIYGIALIVILVSCGVSYFVLHSYKPKVIPVAVIKVKKPAPAPTTVPSTLSGLPVDPSVNDRPVTGVMIENSPDARPQSGLKDASVVFEAIAEGGITRFLALYQDNQPANLGPVRSARPYYVQWCLGFDCSLAHVGGSPEALQDIKNWGVKDLDQFYNSGAYHRISTRYAPHNMYTSIANLNQLEASKGFGKSKFVSFLRKAESPSKTPNATAINMNISGDYYNTSYAYVPQTNSYNRSEGGSAHIDANSNTQISPKVLVVLIVPYTLESDGYHSDYNTIGSGQMYVFQDGTVQTGTWTKTDGNSQLNFSDDSGHGLKLNPGQTWITALSATNQLIYK